MIIYRNDHEQYMSLLRRLSLSVTHAIVYRTPCNIIYIQIKYILIARRPVFRYYCRIVGKFRFNLQKSTTKKIQKKKPCAQNDTCSVWK